MHEAEAQCPVRRILHLLVIEDIEFVEQEIVVASVQIPE